MTSDELCTCGHEASEHVRDGRGVDKQAARCTVCTCDMLDVPFDPKPEPLSERLKRSGQKTSPAPKRLMDRFKLGGK